MASPRPVRSYAKLVSGPSQGAVTRVLPLARVTINGWRLRAVYVPAASVAFGSHVVLIWTVARHTYGIGFHDHEAFACLCSSAEGRRQTLALDKEFVRYTELVSPERSEPHPSLSARCVQEDRSGRAARGRRRR